MPMPLTSHAAPICELTSATATPPFGRAFLSQAFACGADFSGVATTKPPG